jgi:hypothetical protein
VQHRSALEERAGDALRVVAPIAARLGVRLVEIERDRLAEVLGANDELPIVARHGGDPGSTIDRARQDEAFVVVGVLADQIDPAGCALEDRVGTDAILEASAELRAGGLQHARFYHADGATATCRTDSRGEDR